MSLEGILVLERLRDSELLALDATVDAILHGCIFEKVQSTDRHFGQRFAVTKKIVRRTRGGGFFFWR
jgi:hypothetical protein